MSIRDAARMRSLIVTTFAVIAVALAAAPVAGAVAHYYTSAPSTSFSGSQLTSHTWTVQNTSGGTYATLRCTSVVYDGLTPSASGTLTSFLFNFHPAYCSFMMPTLGVGSTAPWCDNAWRVTLNNNYGAGSTIGTWTDCTSFTFHVDFFNCDITYDYTTIANSVGMTDRNAADTADVPYTTAGGMRVGWSNVALTYTSNCPGARSPGTGTFNGTAFFPRIWVGP
jgi:hypothetical protein